MKGLSAEARRGQIKAGEFSRPPTFGCKRRPRPFAAVIIGAVKMRSVSVEEAVAMIPNGATIMVGGFMAVGTSERLVDELVRQNKSS